MQSHKALDPEYLRKHSIRDHRIFGWVGVAISLVLITHTVTGVLDALWRFWPVPFLLGSGACIFRGIQNLMLR